MKKTKVIGLTGGIGSGKSSVLQLFKDRGVPVYMADAEAKHLMQTNVDLIAKIKKSFGEEAYAEGQLNRTFLAQQVFTNPEKLKTLNALVHPEVRKHFKKYLTSVTKPFVIMENAILFESGFDNQCDYIITVTAPQETKILRVEKRDHISAQKVLERMQNQWDDAVKIARSDFVIENLDWQDTIEQVNDIYEKLLERSKK